ncbi:MAG: NAD-dependent epimerase/dehydratase family protein [Spirochaetaceae bacterium]|nr:NAD-dependent epimerase/dehydratase family protein [Spirochaetaceae bacterium]
MITIIGGSGFIGSRLARLFKEQKVDFQIVDKNISPFFPEKTRLSDVRDFQNLKKSLKNSHTVINLAAEHRDDVTPKTLYDEVNVFGAQNVCRACEDLGINKIVFTSSVAVYGFAPEGTDESGEINYFNDYGRTKWEAEGVYREWVNGDPNNRTLTIIRPTVVFGERNRGNVYNLLKQISSRFFPMIGNGKNVKSMAYVENIVAFIHYSLRNEKGEYLFNYIDKPDYSMDSLVRIVKGALGRKAAITFHWPYFLGYMGGAFFDLIAFIIRKKLPISRLRIKKFCSTTCFSSINISKAGFIPPITLDVGIQNTIKFEFVDFESTKDNILFYSE